MKDETRGTTQSEYSGIRNAITKSVGLKEVESDYDTDCLKINPPGEEVDVFIKKLGTTKRATRLTPSSDGEVFLDALESNCTYDVEIFSKGTDPPLLLQKFEVVKDPDGKLSLLAVDTLSTRLVTCFKKSDTPLGGAVVLGDFIDRSGTRCKLTGKTDARGNFKIILPGGVVDNLVAKKGDISVPKKGKIIMPTVSVPSNVPRRSTTIIIETDATNFGSAIVADDDSKVVILGDVTGSMGSKIDLLKKSFNEVVNRCYTNKWSIALAGWDSWTDWCQDKWIQGNCNDATKSVVQAWIGSRIPRGGNDMRQAIENAMRKFPDATDVYIMCDGDVSPFNAEGGKTTGVDVDVPTPSCSSNESSSTSYAGTSWTAFRDRFQKVNFHFVGLGAGARIDGMQKMAITGNGSFWEGNV